MMNEVEFNSGTIIDKDVPESEAVKKNDVGENEISQKTSTLTQEMVPILGTQIDGSLITVPRPVRSLLDGNIRKGVKRDGFWVTKAQNDKASDLSMSDSDAREKRALKTMKSRRRLCGRHES